MPDNALSIFSEPNSERPVHPAAAIYPLLEDEELRALAADIAANGQRDPILTTADGMVIDGRNRLAACALAKVAPVFEVVSLPEGEKEREVAIVALVVSKNLGRRHMTKGQQAMALAMHFPDGGVGGRGKRGAPGNPQAAWGFSGESVRKARAVLRWSRAAADAVMVGAITLDAAYEEERERERQKVQETEAERERRLAAEREAEALRRQAAVAVKPFPKLAERWAAQLVTDQEAVDMAADLVREAEAEHRRKELARQSAMAVMTQIGISLAAPGGNWQMIVDAFVRDWSDALIPPSVDLSPSALRRMSCILASLADALETKER